MTPAQQLNAAALLIPLGIVFFSELSLLFIQPAWLARLAYVPLGTPRRALLTPAARAALAASATYREAASGTLSLARLAGGHPIEVGTMRVRFDRSGTRAAFRLPLGRMLALSGACRVDLVAHRDVVELRAKVLPALAPTGLAFFLPLIILAVADTSHPEGRIAALVLGVVGALVQLVGALRTRMDFSSHADSVMSAIEARLAALA